METVRITKTITTTSISLLFAVINLFWSFDLHLLSFRHIQWQRILRTAYEVQLPVKILIVTSSLSIAFVFYGQGKNLDIKHRFIFPHCRLKHVTRSCTHWNKLHISRNLLQIKQRIEGWHLYSTPGSNFPIPPTPPPLGETKFMIIWN